MEECCAFVLVEILEEIALRVGGPRRYESLDLDALRCRLDRPFQPGSFTLVGLSVRLQFHRLDRAEYRFQGEEEVPVGVVEVIRGLRESEIPVALVPGVVWRRGRWHGL